MLDRSVAPELKKIETLQHSPYSESTHSIGTKIYQAPQRNLGVLRMDIVWTPGSIIQASKYVSRSAFDLALKGHENATAEHIHEMFEYLGYYTGQDVQLFSNQITIKGGKEEFAEAINWFGEHFGKASFPQAELDNYIQIEQANLMRKMQTPGYWSRRVGTEALYGLDSRMAAFANPQDIGLLQPTDLSHYKNNMMALGNAFIVLTGDSGAEELELVNNLLNNANYTSVQNNIVLPQENAFKAMQEPIVYKLAQSNQVSMYMASRFGPVDETSLHKFALLNMILGGFFGSRLMQEIREEQGLTYGIGSYISQSSDGNVWSISGEMNNENAWKAWEATKTIMQELRSDLVGEEELNKAKSYYAGQLRSSFDGPFSISGKIRHLHTRGYSWKHIDTAMSVIWNTTAAEICDLANNYLNPQTFTTTMAGDL